MKITNAMTLEDYATQLRAEGMDAAAITAAFVTLRPALIALERGMCPECGAQLSEATVEDSASEHNTLVYACAEHGVERMRGAWTVEGDAPEEAPTPLAKTHGIDPNRRLRVPPLVLDERRTPKKQIAVWIEMDDFRRLQRYWWALERSAHNRRISIGDAARHVMARGLDAVALDIAEAGVDTSEPT